MGLTGKEVLVDLAGSEEDGSFRIGPMRPGAYQLGLSAIPGGSYVAESVETRAPAERVIVRKRR